MSYDEEAALCRQEQYIDAIKKYLRLLRANSDHRARLARIEALEQAARLLDEHARDIRIGPCEYAAELAMRIRALAAKPEER